MRIALYLQNHNGWNKKAEKFDRYMEKVKEAGVDLLIFPELCWTPFVNHNKFISPERDDSISIGCFELSKYLGCPIVYSSMYDKKGDKIQGLIYSYYVNANPKGGETDNCLYFKHTATDYSAFDYYENYYDLSDEAIFPLINLKGKRIGMTICYDCNYPVFSRMYGKKEVDIIVNSTGGNVVYSKWHRYNKVRAIENSCYNLCTMGYIREDDPRRINNSYVFGLTPNGKDMEYENITSEEGGNNVLGSIYVFDTERQSDGFEKDINIDQVETINNYVDFYYTDLERMLRGSIEVDNDIYLINHKGANIVFCIVPDKKIITPDYFLRLMYSPKLRDYENKKYIIVNKWEKLDTDFYETTLSDILKVRAMENYCAVILDSPEIKKCYQCGKSKVSQVVAMDEKGFGIDLRRTSGPEVTWRGNQSWRDKYESLIFKA
jgi:predicted amidohydrolase